MTLLTIAGIIAILYLGAGLLFGLCFILWGIEKVDTGAAHSSAGFRIIILPGILAFWPVLLRKWIMETKKIKKS